ncbi:MAG: hypothetical protein ABJG68_09350 [Crocinitomicaceae bacterium]
MKNLRRAFALALIAIVVVSCGKERTREEKVSAMIQQVDSPFFVASMNLQTLMDKSEVMKEGTIPFTYYQVISFFLDVELTGIDYGTDVQVIVGEGESFTPNFYGIFKVNDQEKFKGLLETEANAEVKEKDGMNYAIKDSEHYCLVWNDDMAMISSIPINLAAMFTGKGGKEGEKMVDKNIAIINAATEGEIDEDWKTFLTKDADIAMHYDGEGFYDYMTMMSMGEEEELEKMKELNEGISMDMFINFNNGSADFEIISDLSDELREQWAFLGEEGASDKMLTYGKSENPILSGSYKFGVEGALNYVENMFSEEYENMEEDAEKVGLSIEDLRNSTSGEFVYMIDEVKQVSRTVDFGYGDPFEVKSTEPIFGFALGLKDNSYIKSKMEEMMIAQSTDGAEAEGMPEIKVWENGVVQIDEALIYLGEDIMFASNDTAWVNLIAAGQGVKINNPNGVINVNPIGMYVQFAKLANVGELQDQSEMIALFKDLTLSMNLDGGSIHLNFNETDQNSLKLITVAVGEVMADFEKMSNPDMEAELEEAVKQTEDAFGELEEDLEEGLNELGDELEDAFDELNK